LSLSHILSKNEVGIRQTTLSKVNKERVGNYCKSDDLILELLA